MSQHPSPALSFPLAFSALVIGAIAMGVSPVFVRFAEVGPFASAFYRVTLALPPLFIWALWEAKSKNKRLGETLVFNRAVWLTGLFFAGDLTFWHLSITHTTIANATLMACLAPVWVLLLSGIFIGEKVHPKAYLGLALCLLGAALLIGSSFAVEPDRLIGDFYGLITSVFFGLYFLAVRMGRRTHEAGTLTFMGTAITALCLLAITLVSGQSLIPATLNGVAALFALGFISHTGGQGLLTVALGALTAGFSSLVIFVEALAAALFGWLIFAEVLTPLQGLGGIFIMIGIWVARPRPK